jgi:hypothetical protein
MKRNACAISAVAVFALIYLFRHLSGVIDTIDYHGQSFKTARKYWSYEDYKDDPNNLDTNELGRIEKAMAEASLPSTFPSRKEFIHALFELQFPGYGLGGLESRRRLMSARNLPCGQSRFHNGTSSVTWSREKPVSG